LDLVKIQITLVVLATVCLFFRWTSLYASTTYLIGLALVDLVNILRSVRGWDFLTYCAFPNAVSSGFNPYKPEGIAAVADLPYPTIYMYPPLAGYIFHPLCSLPSTLYPVFYLLLLLGVLYMYRSEKPIDILYLTALLTAGYISFHWCMVTGNIGILELFLFALFFYFFKKERHYFMGVIIGIVGFIKILPLVFGASVLFTTQGRTRQFLKKYTIGFMSAYVPLQLLSLIMFPGTSKKYFNFIVDILPGGSFYILSLPSNWANPTLLTAVDAWADRYLNGYGTDIILIGFLMTGLFFLMMNYSNYAKHDPHKVLAFAFIILTLALPRLRNYSIIIVTLPVFLATRDFNWKARSIILFLACSLPYMRLLGMVPVKGSFSIFLDILQTVCLLFTAMFIYYFEKNSTFWTAPA
jgi:hypothetical protein